MKNYVKDFIQTEKFKKLLLILAGVILLLVSFQIGMFVGYRKASFSYGFGDNYYRIFDGRRGRGIGPSERGMFVMGVPRGGFPDSHGAVGKVISVNLPTFIVQDSSGVEKVIRLSDDTAVVEFREKVSQEKITVGGFVVVLGAPNNSSEIEAKLIRIMPAPPDFINGIENSTTTKK